MLKKEITYENPFTGALVTEEHYFHISKTDLLEMEMKEQEVTYVKDGETLTGFRAKVQKVADSQNGEEIMIELKDFIRRAYGKKDGDRFIKSPEIWNDFASTEAFSQLFFEICTNPIAAAEFVNGIIPDNLDQIAKDIQAQAELEKAKTEEPEPSATEVKPPQETPRVLTRQEMIEMPTNELQSGLASGLYTLS